MTLTNKELLEKATVKLKESAEKFGPLGRPQGECVRLPDVALSMRLPSRQKEKGAGAMSIEEDAERLGSEVQKAMTKAMSGQPDVLVFVLRGTEIRDILNEMAAEAEDAAKQFELEGERIVPIRRRVAPQPSGILGYEPSPEVEALHRKVQISSLQQHVKRCRFLATHVEEDRIFKLSIHDLGFLGLVPHSHGLLPIGR